MTTSTTSASRVDDRGALVFEPETRTTYFPNTVDRNDAEVVTVTAGEERAGIDIAVPGDQSGGESFGMMMGRPQTATTAGNGVIRGRVSASDGRPLARARVLLMADRDPFPRQSTPTDGRGQFEFTALAAGSYRVVATKPGFAAPDAMNDPQPLFAFLRAGSTIAVRDGDTQNVDLTLSRLGTIAGSVVDEFGDPMIGANVQLLHVEYKGGRRRLVGAGAARPTDDRGRYRLFNVPPGQYVVSASVGSVNGIDLAGYARSYFPGSPDASGAQFVSVAVSQDIPGIDFSMTPVKTARVAGKLLSASGDVTMGGTVQLRPASSSIDGVAANARIDRDGGFEFPNTAPGQYIIYVDKGRSNPAREGEFAAMPIAVAGSDVSGLTVQLSSGSTIAGRVTFDTTDRSNIPAMGRIVISPVPVDVDLAPQSPASISPEADGTFRMSGINGARRIMATSLPSNWAVKEVRVNGIDATDRPLTFGRAEQSLSDVEVVLTDRVNVVKGTADGSRVLLFATDRGRWYPSSRFLRITTVAADGSFSFSAVPDGSYYVASATRLPADGDDGWQDPAFLETLMRNADTVTIAGGATRTLSTPLRAQ